MDAEWVTRVSTSMTAEAGRHRRRDPARAAAVLPPAEEVETTPTGDAAEKGAKAKGVAKATKRTMGDLDPKGKTPMRSAALISHLRDVPRGLIANTLTSLRNEQTR